MQPTTVWNLSSRYKLDSVILVDMLNLPFIENTHTHFVTESSSFICFGRLSHSTILNEPYACILTSMAKHSQYLVFNGKCVFFKDTEI